MQTPNHINNLGLAVENGIVSMTDKNKVDVLEKLDHSCIHHYCIANCRFFVYGEALCTAVGSMPGFEPFKVETFDVGNETTVPVFHICLSEQPIETESHLQYSFESDGVDSQFFSIAQGYLLQMHHTDGSHLNLWTDTSSRIIYLHGNLMPQMLRFALWLGFGVMTVNYNRIPIHGSCIVNADKAFLFLGESGTGKSTHTRLWRQYISGSSLLNDDSPIIACEPDGIYVYGSPWSGKTPCYKALKFSLGGCVRLAQAPYNKMQRLSPLKAFAALHPSCPPEFAYDDVLYAGISATLDKLLVGVPVFFLACLPDEAAARLSYETLTK